MTTEERELTPEERWVKELHRHIDEWWDQVFRELAGGRQVEPPKGILADEEGGGS